LPTLPMPRGVRTASMIQASLMTGSRFAPSAAIGDWAFEIS
jgi:hypothetical protein